MHTRFCDVVYLLSAAGRTIRTLHAAEAAYVAPRCDITRRRNGRIRELRQRTTPAAEQAWPHTGKPPQNPTPPRITCYMGQRYTRLAELKNAAGDVDHRCHEFRNIHRDDRPLFVLSITDNLTCPVTTT